MGTLGYQREGLLAARRGGPRVFCRVFVAVIMERAGIAKLLAAEAEAKEIIEGAKRERAALQKQSKLEAEQAIAEFKEAKDQEYEQLTSSVDTSDYAKGLNDQVDKEIEQMRKDAKKNVAEITELLLKYTGDVDVSVHRNNQKEKVKA